LDFTGVSFHIISELWIRIPNAMILWIRIGSKFNDFVWIRGKKKKKKKCTFQFIFGHFYTLRYKIIQIRSTFILKFFILNKWNKKFVFKISDFNDFLDPDMDGAKMLDPDPYNPDPQPCIISIFFTNPPIRRTPISNQNTPMNESRITYLRGQMSLFWDWQRAGWRLMPPPPLTALHRPSPPVQRQDRRLLSPPPPRTPSCC
jgi:hypothetical protein